MSNSLSSAFFSLFLLCLMRWWWMTNITTMVADNKCGGCKFAMIVNIIVRALPPFNYHQQWYFPLFFSFFISFSPYYCHLWWSLTSLGFSSLLLLKSLNKRERLNCNQLWSSSIVFSGLILIFDDKTEKLV